MVAVRRSRAAGLLIAATAVPLALRELLQQGFVGTHGAIRSVRVQRQAAYEEDFPNLVRVEELIQDSCRVKDGEAEIECLRMYDKLARFHENTKAECNLDNLRCIVLDVLDRLCSGIEGGDGLILLNRVSNAVLGLRSKFTNWGSAFSFYDKDHSGSLSQSEMVDMLAKMNVGLTEKETAVCFFAADANGDGKISPEEFSDFMTAAVFAEDTLKDMEADPLPKKLETVEDYLKWSTKDRDSSWSSLAKLYR